MEGPDRVRLLLVGLFLAAIVVGYLIFTQRYNSGVVKVTSTPKPVQQITEVSPPPSPSAALLGSSTGSTPATTKGGLPEVQVSNLPNTGGPTDYLLFVSAAVAAAGWFLRKFSS